MNCVYLIYSVFFFPMNHTLLIHCFFGVGRILSLKQDGQSLKYEGGWLLTSPSEMKKSLVMSSAETIVTTSISAFDDVALAQERNDSYGSMSVTGHYMLQKRSK